MARYHITDDVGSPVNEYHTARYHIVNDVHDDDYRTLRLQHRPGNDDCSGYDCTRNHDHDEPANYVYVLTADELAAYIDRAKHDAADDIAAASHRTIYPTVPYGSARQHDSPAY